MGAHKGQNNFKKMQSLKVASNMRLITQVLDSIKKGTIFTNENSLIVYVSEKIGLHRTTIKRNSIYLRKVLIHFSTQPGAVGFVTDEHANAAMLRAKLLAEKAKSRNLEAENIRLIKTLERMSSTLPESQSTPHIVMAGDVCSQSTTSDHGFINTAMMLLIVIGHLEEKGLGIKLDLDKRQIVDITETGTRRVIASPLRTKWFFEWLDVYAPLGKLPAGNFKQ